MVQWASVFLWTEDVRGRERGKRQRHMPLIPSIDRLPSTDVFCRALTAKTNEKHTEFDTSDNF